MNNSITPAEEKILKRAAKIMSRIRMEKVPAERRQEIAKKASAAGLVTRRANAVRRLAEKANQPPPCVGD